MTMDDGTYYLKAMNCPHHHVMYRSKPRSYRDLPVRYAEYGTVYRNELSGTLAGLLRVRALTMNDAHIYCTKEQIKAEFAKVLELTLAYFKLFGLTNYWFRLSKWDSSHSEKYINEPANWEMTESALREILVESKVPFTEVSDEAAFYGPKVDVQFKSALGREETMSTIQLDFLAKDRFKLEYTDNEGKSNGEVFVIHRAPLSTHERFMAFLIEHYAGAFPVWLSPKQVVVIPIGEAETEYSQKVYQELKSKGVRVSIDPSSESLGKRIREAKLKKVPYILVIGKKEVEANSISVESRDEGALGAIPLEKFIEKITPELKPEI